MSDENLQLKYTATTCPYCGVGCGLNLVSKGNTLVGVEPYKRSPINEGKLCPKGATCWETVQKPGRLTKPLIKKGDKFEEASWDEALDLIVKKFTEISDKLGPKALGFQTSCRTVNEDCYAFQKWARCGFLTNNVDNCARICHGPSVAGLSLSFGSGAATNPFEDVLNSDLIVMWGSNAVEAHPLAARRVMQAKKKGTPIIVVDPRYSPTARLADKYIRFNPSTHIALANNMMYYIIKEGLEDKEFIKERTKGFDDLKKTVEKYADATNIHGVPQETVKEFARQYAKAKNAVIIYCLGITELTTGTDNVRSMGNLALLTGNVGRPGVGVNPLRGQNNVQGACDMGAYPNVFSGYQAVAVPENRAKHEKAWFLKEGSLPDWYGSTLTEQINDAGNVVKAMYFLGLNPTVSYPDSNHVRAQLQKLDFCVMQDIYWNESCEYADVVLPGTCFAEKDGTFTSGERRVNRVRKAVNGPGESKYDWEIISMLAKKMGLKGFDWKSSKDVWDDMRAVTPGQFGVTYEKMEKPESVHWPCPTVEHPGTPILHIGKFSAADGKGTMFGLEYHPPAEVADAEYPYTLMTGRCIFHYHTRTQTDRSPTLHNDVPENYMQMNTQDAKELGIKPYEKVRVTSRRGESIAVARVTDDVGPKVLYMPMHFVHGANDLTNTALDPLSKMPELKHCAVKVEKITEAWIMTKKGDMLYAWTNDAEIQKKAELGGAVTSLWKYALESKMVDAVLAITKGVDLYDAVPVIVTDPKDLVKTAGSLHCGTLLIPKLIKKYLDGAKNKKIGVTVKGCDAMAFYELAKRKQINLDNIVMIGVNCGGSVSPVTARKMIADKYGVDPEKVHKEEIDKGQFIIEYEGGHKGISVDELEEAGYGRRSNCRRCKMKVPRQADLACGNWGVIGPRAGKATFVEICSEKGAALVDGAVKKGILATEPANPKGLEIRGKVEGAMFKLGDKWRKHDFEGLGEGKDRLKKIMSETARCIKCYQCIDQCPICYCVDCTTKNPAYVAPGELPVPFMFHLIRYAHIADSCVNCGQCEEVCPAEIPNAMFMHAQQQELEKMFGHVPGTNMELPLMAYVEEKEERLRLHNTGSDMIYQNVFNPFKK